MGPFRSLKLLKPAADLTLVPQVVRGKPRLQVALFPRNHHQRHKCERGKEHEQYAETVDPGSESDLEQRESQVDRIAAEAVGASANNQGGGAVARNGSARLSEGTHGRNEEGDGYQHTNDADRRAH